MIKIYQKYQDRENPFPLAIFRFLFGILMIWELMHYSFGRNEIEDFFLNPTFHFKYPLFEWVPNLSTELMIFYLFLLGVLFFMFAIGLFYRIVSVLCFIVFTWFFLMERAIYLNHWYLVCLLLFLMQFLPANRVFSIDYLMGRYRENKTIPRWCVLSILTLTGIVYFFSGIAKINSDWLHGQPLTLIFKDEQNKLPYFLRHIFTNPSIAYWLGILTLLIEVFAFPLLMHKKLRYSVAGVLIIFHLLNLFIFPIGNFPLVMIILTCLFLPKEWLFMLKNDWNIKVQEKKAATKKSISKPVLWILIIFFVIQIILPYRKILYKGNQLWTEEGNLFSWPMFTAYRGGNVYFITHHDNHIQRDTIYPKQQDLTVGQYNRMIKSPDMILQYAHHLEELYREQNINEIKIYVDASAFLNGRPIQRFIHPNIDLTKEKRRYLRPYPWVLPLAHLLPDH